MSDRNQTQPAGPDFNAETANTILAVVSRSLAVPAEVLLHRADSFGERYFGLPTALAVLSMFFYPALWNGRGTREMTIVIIVFLALVAWARMRSFARVRRGGAQPHSRYTGTPRILRVLRFVSERKVKCAVEPMLVFLAGVFTLPFSEPLGSYVMFMSFGLFASTNVNVGTERRRALDLHDALMEQRDSFDLFREMQNRR